LKNVGQIVQLGVGLLFGKKTALHNEMKPDKTMNSFNSSVLDDRRPRRTCTTTTGSFRPRCRRLFFKQIAFDLWLKGFKTRKLSLQGTIGVATPPWRRNKHPAVDMVPKSKQILSFADISQRSAGIGIVSTVFP